MDIPLNPKGIQQARATAERIAREWLPAAVYASPLQRASKTAEIIAEKLRLPVIQHEDLLDINYGAFAGLTGEEARALNPEIYDGWLASPGEVVFPQGESLADLRLRTDRFMKEVCGNHSGQTIVAVGHTVANRVILLSALRLDNNRLWDLGQSNCAINRIDCVNGYFRVITINATGHLHDI